MATTKKKIKTSDIFKGLTALTLVVVAVMGWHWTDTAEKSFWQTFWIVAAILSLIVWAALWAYFWNREKHRQV